MLVNSRPCSIYLLTINAFGGYWSVWDASISNQLYCTVIVIVDKWTPAFVKGTSLVVTASAMRAYQKLNLKII